MADRRRRRRNSSQSESELTDEDTSGDSSRLNVSKTTSEGDTSLDRSEEVDHSEYESAEEDHEDDEDDEEEEEEETEEETEGETETEGESVVLEESYDDGDEEWVDQERQSGDGQEHEPDESTDLALDDDEDKKNPAYIPRRGAFYEHDTRMSEDMLKEEQRPKKKLWKDDGKWLHDKFSEDQQAPKSREEIIAMYGYDIRAHEKPPDGLMPRGRGRRGRGGRGRRNLGDFIHDDDRGDGDYNHDYQQDYRREKQFDRNKPNENEMNQRGRRGGMRGRGGRPPLSNRGRRVDPRQNFGDRRMNNRFAEKENREVIHRRVNVRNSPDAKHDNFIVSVQYEEDLQSEQWPTVQQATTRSKSEPRSPRGKTKQWTNSNYRNNEPREPRHQNNDNFKQESVNRDIKRETRSASPVQDNVDRKSYSRDRRTKTQGGRRNQEMNRRVIDIERQIDNLQLEDSSDSGSVEVKREHVDKKNPVKMSKKPSSAPVDTRSQPPPADTAPTKHDPNLQNQGRPKRYSSQRQRNAPDMNYTPQEQLAFFPPGAYPQSVYQQGNQEPSATFQAPMIPQPVPYAVAAGGNPQMTSPPPIFPQPQVSMASTGAQSVPPILPGQFGPATVMGFPPPPPFPIVGQIPVPISAALPVSAAPTQPPPAPVTDQSGKQVYSRGGTTYYPPEAQHIVSPKRSPARRPKAAIPIVNPQDLATYDPGKKAGPIMVSEMTQTTDYDDETETESETDSEYEYVDDVKQGRSRDATPIPGCDQVAASPTLKIKIVPEAVETKV